VTNKLNRRKFIKAAAAGGVASAAVAAPAIAQSMPEVKWRLTASWPKSLDTLYGACEQISKRVAELTDNKFQIQPFAAGEIVPGLQVLDAVQNGTVECGHTALYYYFGKDDTFVFGSALPFGMNPRQQNAWLIHGGGQQLLNDFLKKYNSHFIPAGNTNCQMGGWFSKQIKTADDLKGLKFRLGGFAGRIMTRLGVVPQQIVAGDIYPALEKGTIDGAEWVGPHDDEKLGFYKVAKYNYFPGWHQPYTAQYLYVKKAAWDDLAPAAQAQIETACTAGVTIALAKAEALQFDAIKKFEKEGVKAVKLNDEILKALQKASAEVVAEEAAKDPLFKKILDSQQTFAAGYQNWKSLGYLPRDWK